MPVFESFFAIGSGIAISLFLFGVVPSALLIKKIMDR